jgi:hypothetical protein
MKPLILDISDPKCDIRNLFQRFINQYWTKVGGPGYEVRISQEFSGRDVRKWVESLAACSSSTEVLIATWVSTNFIRLSADQFRWHFNDIDITIYCIIDVEDWCTD